MSISTLGLSGTSPTQGAPFPFGRRGSVSTANSDAIDESAIDDDDIVGRSAPTTPFTRRMSFGTQALRGARGGVSPGTSGRAPSYTTAPLPSIPSGPRSARAGSGSQTQTQAQSGGVTPPMTQDQTQASMQSKPRTGSDLSSARSAEGSGFNWSEQLRTRAESSVSQTQRPSFSIPFAAKSPNQERKSITEMPAPPAAIPPPAPARSERKKPDEFQERILKGDFYIS
jgi:hypothetical protein